MDLFSHVAFGIVALSFAVRDILWLRALAALASTIMVAGELQRLIAGSPYRTATLFWHALFLAINAYWISRLLYGESHAHLDEEEQELYDTLFRDFTRLEFAALLRSARWETAAAGDLLASQDQELPKVVLLYSGEACVEVDGERVGAVHAGQFVGEMSFLTGDPASSTVRVTQATRHLAWHKSDLRQLLTRSPSIRSRLASVMGVDVSKKLRLTSKRS